MKTSLNHRVITYLLQHYYQLLELEDDMEIFETIYHNDVFDEDPTPDEIIELVETYMTDLKNTIDEYNNSINS